jgi:hypothetical protein
MLGVMLLLAWVGGNHTAARQNRLVAESHAILSGENSKLRLEIDELKALVFSLQSQLNVYKDEVARLSADLAAYKER